MTEVAAVVAVMAVITLVFAKTQPGRRGSVSPPVTVSTEVPSRQPLAVFHVYVGCAQAPQDVRRDGRHIDMPVTVFDHNPVVLQVFDNAGDWVSITVRLGANDAVEVVNGPATYVNNYLSVGVGPIPVCV
ncbi:MAG: hypothetical protein V9E89_04780 [Ilumatobacteraceae bacterium]